MAEPPAAKAIREQNALVSADTRWKLDQKGNLPMPQGMAAAHASSLLVMPRDHPAAVSVFWFSGDHEGYPNVQIAASQFDRSSQQWLPAKFVANREIFGAQVGYSLRRFGNPVSWLDADGRIHLFVVATGPGGWAASRILHLRQKSPTNDLQHLEFEARGILPLSWFWNLSFLVRSAPLPLADGGMVLPVHFELGFKIPYALRFDAKGNFIGMVRIARRTDALQPSIVMQTASNWLAFMRQDKIDGNVLMAETHDGGSHWFMLPESKLVNPDSSVVGLSLAPSQMLLAHNSSPLTRNFLDLSQSPDGINWQLVQRLGEGKNDDEFSYPAVAWADGRLWISYTVDRHFLSWQTLVPESNPVSGWKTVGGAKK